MKNFIKSLFITNRADIVYDETFFQSQWFESWKELKEVLKQLIELESCWKRILDFGCGSGVMVDLMNDEDWQYFGCDYSSEVKELYME